MRGNEENTNDLVYTVMKLKEFMNVEEIQVQTRQFCISTKDAAKTGDELPPEVNTQEKLRKKIEKFLRFLTRGIESVKMEHNLVSFK